MKEKKVSKQYKIWAESYDYDKVKLFEKAEVDYYEFMTSFIEICALKPGMKILDVGAGTGLTSIFLARALSGNFRILAIEPSGEMLERAKSNIEKEGLRDIILIVKAKGEDIPFEDECYDLITSTFAIRHMEVEKALTEFKRVLKPEGKIVIADIAAPEKWRTLGGRIFSSLITLFLSLKGKYKGEAESKVLTVAEWKDLIGRMGLIIVQLKEFPGKKDPEWALKRVMLSLLSLIHI